MLFIIFLLLNHQESFGDVCACFSCTGGGQSVIPNFISDYFLYLFLDAQGRSV